MTPHHDPGRTAASERWLAAALPVVRAHLPAAPAAVVEIGCGSLGGFVPALRAGGYEAIGIDPEAPEEPSYRRIEFERAEIASPVDAVVASASLHHVADPVAVVDLIARILAPGGVAVVIEWAWERFDERTAAWAFARLPDDDEGGWLRRRRDEWLVSNRAWSEYLHAWAGEAGLHRADRLVSLLEGRLERRSLARGPYVFPELGGTSEADERAAIDAGEIEPTRVEWVGSAR